MAQKIPDNNNKFNIKVLKMMSGEDIIAYVFPKEEMEFILKKKNDQAILIGAPKIIWTEQQDDGELMMMSKDWIPYAQIPIVLLRDDFIAAVITPTSQYIEFYLDNYVDAQYYVSDFYHQKMWLEMCAITKDDPLQ